MRRGDVVTVAGGGGFGSKPRPALVIQADQFARLGTVLLVLFTSTPVGAQIFRPRYEPDGMNGLLKPSELMVDILLAVRREQIGGVIGRLSTEDLNRADIALMVVLGLAA